MQNGKMQDVCNKIYKTKGGLKRHVNLKPIETPEDILESQQISNAALADLVEQSSKDLSEDLCFPPDVCSSLGSFKFPNELSSQQAAILNEIALKYKILTGKGNVEKFFVTFYATIVPKAVALFPGLPRNSATLLSTKLADKIIVYSKKPKQQNGTSAVRTLSENETAALQYLGGYILFNLNKKIFKSMLHKTLFEQQHIAILKAGHSFDAENQQRLVDSISRCGLWKITDFVEKIFIRAELHFNAKTMNFTKNINLQNMIQKVIVDQEVVALFQTWTSSCALKIDDTVGEDFLNCLLKLYFKVRSFSHAKDVINKFKSIQRKKKSRSLRTEIKRSSDKPTIQQ